jgi:hypothetical protein
MDLVAYVQLWREHASEPLQWQSAKKPQVALTLPCSNRPQAVNRCKQRDSNFFPPLIWAFKLS